MINAHVRDAAAVIGFAAEMEEIMLSKFFLYLLCFRYKKNEREIKFWREAAKSLRTQIEFLSTLRSWTKCIA